MNYSIRLTVKKKDCEINYKFKKQYAAADIAVEKAKVIAEGLEVIHNTTLVTYEVVLE